MEVALGFARRCVLVLSFGFSLVRLCAWGRGGGACRACVFFIPN